MDDLKKDLTRFEDKIDKISDDLSDIKVVQAEQAIDLKYHITRTALNEHRIETIEERLVPVFRMKNNIDLGFMVAGKFGAILGLIFAAVKAIETLVNWL